MRFLICVCLIIYLLIPNVVLAQSCLPDGIEFTTQGQIDSFAINYPACTEIEGSVRIIGDSIVNLNGLHQIESIGTALIIQQTHLINLQGLENLTYIGDVLYISINQFMETLNGLGSLVHIDRTLSIYGNSTLTSLEGLNSLEYIGYNFHVYGNESLQNFAGLNNLYSIGNEFEVISTGVVDFSGLENLTQVFGGIRFDHNPNLINLAGLASLERTDYFGIYDSQSFTSLYGLNSLEYTGQFTLNDLPSLANITNLYTLDSIDGNFSIYYCPTLQSLSGLENVQFINGGFVVYECHSLINLDGLQNIQIVDGSVGITKCDSLSSIAELHNIKYIGGGLSIEVNPSLTSLIGLDSLKIIGNDLSIKECHRLKNLIGLERVDSIRSIFIRNNDSIESIDDLEFESSYLNNLWIGGNKQLSSLHGLEMVDSANHISIGVNNMLTDLTGLNNIKKTRHLWIDENDSLRNLHGLENLTSVPGLLQIRDNDNLISLDGLNNLSKVWSVYITSNDTLSTIMALGNLDSINGGLHISNNKNISTLSGIDSTDLSRMHVLYISDNPLLMTCDVHSICEYLENPGDDIQIYNNAPGCNSQAEVEAACGIIGISENKEEQAVYIYPNPSDHYVNIRYSLLDTRYSLLIYDCLGRKMDEINVPAGQEESQIDVSQYANGIYIAILEDNSGSFFKQKFVVAR